ncbi:MAG: hypothetical protein AW07_00459 [Candidatus Accumulibacter sp. SK-11]|nr:MAG: hypothetical protein AW07_00459 [Candidatus Accumulibacter sp. SK-11]
MRSLSGHRMTVRASQRALCASLQVQSGLSHGLGPHIINNRHWQPLLYHQDIL